MDHTGELTRRQREWTAILSAWPAALAAESALPGPVPGRVQIAVGRGRTVRVPAWVDVSHVTHLRERAWWHRSPPRIRIEHALLDVMSAQIRAGDIAAAFTQLTVVMHSRRTTVPRILAALRERRRITGRRLIVTMLTGAHEGVCSVLERGYRDRVERAHGLPVAQRQRVSTATGAATHQDVWYPEYSLVVELDGHLFHSATASRDADAGRDLAELAVSGAPTARVTYGLVFTTPCQTAVWIAAILRARGWRGSLLKCPRC